MAASSKNAIERYYCELNDKLSDFQVLSSLSKKFEGMSLIDSDNDAQICNANAPCSRMLLDLLQLKLEQSDEYFPSVISVLKEEGALAEIVEKMEANHELGEELGDTACSSDTGEYVTVKETISSAEKLKDSFDSLIYLLMKIITSTTIVFAWLKATICLRLKYERQDSNTPEVQGYLTHLQECQSPESVIMFLIHKNFLQYLNLGLLNVFKSVVSSKEFNEKLEEYKQLHRAFMQSNLENTVKAFKQNPELVGLPQMTVELKTPWSLYDWEKMVCGIVGWAEYILIERIDIKKNYGIITYRIMPFIIPRIVKDLSSSNIIECFKKVGATFNISDVSEQGKKDNEWIGKKINCNKADDYSFQPSPVQSQANSGRWGFNYTNAQKQAIPTSGISCEESPRFDFSTVSTIEKFKEFLGIKSIEFPFFPLLLTITGLTGSGRKEAVDRAFSVLTDESSFSHHEIIAHGFKRFYKVELIPAKEADQCLLLAFESGIKCNSSGKMNIHLAENAMSENTEATSFDYRDFLTKVLNFLQRDKMLSEAQDVIRYGIGLINIWDMPFNRTVRPFLESFGKCFSRNYMCIFVSLEDDEPNLYLPPNAPEDHDKNCFRWRPRIQYLLRTSHLSLGANKKVCTIFACFKSSKFESEEWRKHVDALSSECKNAAEQMGIQDRVDFNVIPVESDDPKPLRHKLREIVKNLEQEMIPLSWICLRNYLAEFSDLYIKHDELLEHAGKVNMDETDVSKFCKFFSSFGSLLDIKQVNSESPYVIINPPKFLKHLHELLPKYSFNSTNELTKIENRPLIVDTIRILADVGIAFQYNADPFQYYISPSVKSMKQDTHFELGAIQFVISIKTPRLNTNVAITKKLLQELPNSTLHLSKEFANALAIKTYKIDEKRSVDVALGFKADVIEVQLQASKEQLESDAEEICATVIKTFHETMKLKHKKLDKYHGIKYHFAVLCVDDEFGDDIVYSAYRIRHILPNKVCDNCKKKLKERNVYEERNLVIEKWSTLMKENKDYVYTVSEKMRLNGDLTMENASMLASEISKYPPEALEIFAKELKVEGLLEKLKNRKVVWIVLALIQEWLAEREGTQEITEESSEKAMARKLLDMENKAVKRNLFVGEGQKKPDFKQLARKIDMQVLTKEERSAIVEDLKKSGTTK